MSSAFHPAGDDCAINELLEGRMDLDVILPDNRKVRLTVERRTPMMDLLVQAASATKISPGSHTIQIFGDHGSHALHYKPSTPIGSLDTNTICIVPKRDVQETTLKRVSRVANRPFEPTFRVQVHLPRNQLMVSRVSPRIKVSELLAMVCQEKNLDRSRYQMVRPTDPSKPLPGNMTLSEYGSTELTLMSNASIESHICNSTSHIMPYSKRIEEQKKKTGILGLLEDSNHKEDEKKAMIQSAVQHLTSKLDSAPCGRYKQKKRRPAPQPPPPDTTFHSRQSSSDSSGYHETTSSFLHEEHPPQIIDEKANSDSSGVSSLECKAPPTQTSSQGGKKRKAPPPPSAGKSEDFYNDDEVPEVQEVLNEKNEIYETAAVYKVEDERHRKTKDLEEKAVTGVALAAFHARIEQDVTQQKIESSIQAAFQSLESHSTPQLLSIKQRAAQESIGSSSCRPDSLKAEITAPEPQINKSSDLFVNEGKLKSAQNTTRINFVNNENKLDPDITDSDSIRQEATGVSSVQLRSLGVPEHKSIVVKDEVKKVESCSTSSNLVVNVYPLQKSSAGLSLNVQNGISEVVQSIDDSISDGDDTLESFPPPPTEFGGEIDSKPKLVSLKRSSSLLNISPTSTVHKSVIKSELKRSLSNLTADDKTDFESEQDKLQKQYIKLQKQFILWQQQLLDNHAMLREECMVPQYARTLRQSHSLPDGEDYSEDGPPSCPLVARSLSYEPDKEKCLTLPRSSINIPEFGSVPVLSSTLRSSKVKNYFKPPPSNMTRSRQRLPPEIRKEGDMDIMDETKILSTILPPIESLKMISEDRSNENELKNCSKTQNGASVVKVGPNLQNGTSVTINGVAKTEKKCPNVLATLPKPKMNGIVNRTNIENVPKTNIAAPKTNGEQITVSVHTKKNGTVFGNNNTVKLFNFKNSELGSGKPPVAPPLPTQGIKSNGYLTIKSDDPVNNFSKSAVLSNNGSSKNVQISTVDSRDQLMYEIRRFGGRTALKKISLDIAS